MGRAARGESFPCRDSPTRRESASPLSDGLGWPLLKCESGESVYTAGTGEEKGGSAVRAEGSVSPRASGEHGWSAFAVGVATGAANGPGRLRPEGLSPKPLVPSGPARMRFIAPP